jgi:hypothetical protein
MIIPTALLSLLVLHFIIPVAGSRSPTALPRVSGSISKIAGKRGSERRVCTSGGPPVPNGKDGFSRSRELPGPNLVIRQIT